MSAHQEFETFDEFPADCRDLLSQLALRFISKHTVKTWKHALMDAHFVLELPFLSQQYQILGG